MTNQQEIFLDLLFYGEEGIKGNVHAAAEAAGYAPRYVPTLVKALREEIRDRTVDKLTSAAPQAAMTVADTMFDDGTTPKGELRLKAAEAVLDRMGVGKQTGIDITSKDESISPLFILPSKSEVEVDPEFDGIEINKQ